MARSCRPAKKKTIDPGDDYPGVPRLVRLLKLVGDLPPDADVAPDSTLYQGPIVDAMKHFQAEARPGGGWADWQRHSGPVEHSAQ